MKNAILLSILLSLFAVTCSTFGITITSQDMGGGQLQIGYQLEPGEVPLGFGLQVELSNGASVISAVGSPHFPIYMDSAYTQEMLAPDSYIYGGGTPIAQTGAPGELLLPVSNFSICMAAPLALGMGPTGDFNYDAQVDLMDLLIMSSEWLSGGFTMTDLDGNDMVNLLDYAMMAESEWAGSLDNLITLQLDDGGAGSINVAITADSLRGGVAGENGSISFDPVQTTIFIPEPATLSLLGLGGLALFRKRRVGRMISISE